MYLSIVEGCDNVSLENNAEMGPEAPHLGVGERTRSRLSAVDADNFAKCHRERLKCGMMSILSTYGGKVLFQQGK